MSSPDRTREHRLDIVVYPGFKAIEAVAILNVFDSANAYLHASGLPIAYDIRITSVERGLVASDTLIMLEASKMLDSFVLPDTAIIVGTRNIEQVLTAVPEISSWCKEVHGRVGRLVGVCSASFFLAEAGLLDDKRATTHWRFAPLLQRRYPRVNVDLDAIFVRAGTIWTSAGVTSAIDLALALVEEDVGRDVALAVARDLVVYLKRPGGQAQFSVPLHSQMTRHAGIRELQAWLLINLNQPLSIAMLAQRAAMSKRNFARVFTRETGYSPAEFIEMGRVELVRRLLEEGDLCPKAIAIQSGFRSDSRMRRAFKRRCGITPSEYRARFSVSGIGRCPVSGTPPKRSPTVAGHEMRPHARHSGDLPARRIAQVPQRSK